LVTYHGPGQLVGYPIVRLRARGLTVPDYVHALEAAIVSALDEIGVRASTDDQHVGVWTALGKIAAIGIAQRHGVVLHGFAVNLDPDLSHFELINPCGIGDRGVTSAAAILGRTVDVPDFKARLTRALDSALDSSTTREPMPGHHH
jgi:lipoate-protein ligase B